MCFYGRSMNDFIQYYGPDYRLSIPQLNLENSNSSEHLSRIRIQILEQLRQLKGAPSIEMQVISSHVAPELMDNT